MGAFHCSVSEPGEKLLKNIARAKVSKVRDCVNKEKYRRYLALEGCEFTFLNPLVLAIHYFQMDRRQDRKEDREEIIRILVEAGTSLTTNTHSMLHLVENHRLITLFVEKGIDLEFQNRNGQTALQTYVSKAKWDAAVDLLEFGARFDKLNLIATARPFDRVLAQFKLTALIRLKRYHWIRFVLRECSQIPINLHEIFIAFIGDERNLRKALLLEIN
jgi:hypothetical protein